ncbi:hypothetical protein IFR05_002332 [Cadophora sp. M221]|nr:hypothetical protein IFR05_002332 [Cadophora sp. M221]
MSGQGVNPFSIAKGGSKPKKPASVKPPPRKLRKGEDAFDRDIANTLSTDQFKRQLDIAYHKLDVARGKVEDLLTTGSLPSLEILNEEISSRLETVAKGTEVIAACQKILNEWKRRKFTQKEKVREHRKRIQETVGNLVPEVTGMLSKIEHRLELETNRLHLENIDLNDQNRELRDAASNQKKRALEASMATQKTQLEGDVKLEKRKAEYFEGKWDDAMEKLSLETEAARKAKDESDQTIRTKIAELEKANAELKVARSKVEASDGIEDLTNKIASKQSWIEELEELRPLKGEIVAKDRHIAELRSKVLELETSLTTSGDEALREAMKKIEELTAHIALRSAPPVPSALAATPRLKFDHRPSALQMGPPRTPGLPNLTSGQQTQYTLLYGQSQIGAPCSQLSRHSSFGSASSASSESSGTRMRMMSPTSAGQMGPPYGDLTARTASGQQQHSYMQQPRQPAGQPLVQREYSSLISGTPAQGPRTMDVHPSLIEQMDSQS